MHALIRLVALLLVAVGNWLVLTILLGLGFKIAEGIFGTAGISDWLPYGSALAVLAIGVVSASPLGEWVARLFYPIRKLTQREESMLIPAFDRVRDAYAKRLGRRLMARLYLIDDPMPQAMALGRGTIAVTRGALEVSKDDELTGLLAHEVAHLHHKDSMFTMALMGMHGITYVQGMLAWSWVLVSGTLSLLALIKGVFLTWVTLLIFAAPFILLAGILVSVGLLWVVTKGLCFADRSVEYRADRFAGALGFGPGLVGFLERLAGMDANSEHRFLVMYLQHHPPIALRIDRLEQMQEVKAAA